MARQMVVNYGFSDIGPWSLLDPSAQSQDMIMRMMAKNSTSESLQRKIDEAVKKIADEAYEVALGHIRWLLHHVYYLHVGTLSCPGWSLVQFYGVGMCR